MKQYLVLTAIVALFFITVPGAYAESLGDQWKAVKAALSDAEKASTPADASTALGAAQGIYTTYFRDAAIANDPEDDTIIADTFSENQQLAQYSNIDQLKLNRQIIDKTIYKIAYHQVENAIAANDADKLLQWFTVLEAKFKFSEKDYALNAVIADVSSSGNVNSAQGETIKADVLEIFKLKTFEEIEEAIQALNADDAQGAKKFAYEGLYYYRTLHPDLDSKVGSERSGQLLDYMAQVIDVTESSTSKADKIAELEVILGEVELILREYEGGDTSAVGLALSGIKDRLALIDIEYVDAVEGGVITHQGEYDETVAFMNKAIEIYNEHSAELSALSASDAAGIINNLNAIEAIVMSYGDEAEVTILVGKALNDVATLQDLSGGAVETDVFGYLDEIDRLLAEAKTAYASGNTQLAYDLVSEAYLDNYEFVEGPLGEVDRELMLKIEMDMREDLRSMIQAGDSVANVNAQIDMILDDLAIARQVVPEFGTIAVMILAVAIISIVALSARSKLSLTPRI